MFTARNISKSYPSPQGNITVLESINLHVNEGSFTAIIGESGSGKSTLLQILGTLDHADSGDIIVNGTLTHQLPESKLATLRNQNIGFIYQSHHLIPELSAVENVMLPLLIQGKSIPEAKKRASSLLSKLGLGSRETHIPAHLSGGEAQRVAVARAVVTRPRIILADEPTGNLDETTASTVFKMMRKLCKSEQVAVIMVTHSLTFANACDAVYKLTNHSLNKVIS